MRPLLAARLHAHRPLLVLALAALPGLAAAADPLEDFRQVLSQVPNLEDKKQIKAHQDRLEKAAAALKRPSDLRRALLLPGWHGNGEFPQQAPGEEENPLVKAYQKIYRDLTERLQASLRDGLESNDPGRRLAAVTFLSSMAREENKRKGPPVPAQYGPQGLPRLRFTASMAADVRKVLASDKDADVCAVAAEVVVAIAPTDAATLDALKPLLEPEREVVERRAAAEGLGRMFGFLADHLQQRPLPIYQAGSRIARVAGSGLRDKDAAVRRLCLETIRQAAQQIHHAVERNSRQPQEALAVYRLLPGAVNEQMAAVIGLLSDGDPEVRLSAHQVLEEIAAVRRHLSALPLLEQPLPLPRGDELPPPENGKPSKEGPKGELLDGVLKALPALKKSLADDEKRVRLAALYVLETLGDAAAPAVVEIVECLKHENGFVRWGAVRVLHNMAPQAPDKAVPALAGALKDNDKTVRLTAANALRRYGPIASEAVGPLGAAVGDTEPRVRLAAINALAAIGEKAASQTGVLIRALKDDKTPEARAAAAKTLGRLGVLGKESVEALRFALRDPDAAVRQAAGDALLDNP